MVVTGVDGRMHGVSPPTNQQMMGAAVVAAILLLKLAFVAAVLGWI